MSKTKNFFKSIAKAPKDIFNALSGKTAREHEKMKQEITRINQETEIILEQVEDFRAFERFRAKMASEYFTGLAEKMPEMADEYRDLAELAAKVNPDKMRGSIAAYGAGESDARRWHTVRERYSDEINAYVFAHIDSFAQEDPKRWERMQKNAPALAAKAQKAKPPAP